MDIPFSVHTHPHHKKKQSKKQKQNQKTHTKQNPNNSRKPAQLENKLAFVPLKHCLCSTWAGVSTHDGLLSVLQMTLLNTPALLALGRALRHLLPCFCGEALAST